MAPPNILPGYAEVIVLRDAVRQYAYTLRSYQYQGPDYTNLYRDVQGLQVQTEALELLMRQGQSRYEIRRAMRNVVTQAGLISSDVSGVELSLQQAWWNLQVQLQQASQAVGVRGTIQIQPSYPVILNRPSWSQLPFQPIPQQPSSRNQETIQVADELVTRIDAYTASLQLLSPRNVNASKLIGSLQDLRHATLGLRQTAASGAFGNTLIRSSNALMVQYQRTARDFTTLVARDSTLNSPLFYQIGELSQKLQNATRGTRT